jgi:hypothetical protein
LEAGLLLCALAALTHQGLTRAFLEPYEIKLALFRALQNLFGDQIA